MLHNSEDELLKDFKRFYLLFRKLTFEVKLLLNDEKFRVPVLVSFFLKRISKYENLKFFKSKKKKKTNENERKRNKTKQKKNLFWNFEFQIKKKKKFWTEALTEKKIGERERENETERDRNTIQYCFLIENGIIFLIFFFFLCKYFQ